MQPEPQSVINDLTDERLRLWSGIAGTHIVVGMEVRRLLKKLDKFLATSKPDMTTAIALHEQAYLSSYLQKISDTIRLFDASEEAGLPAIAAAISRAHSFYVCGEIKMSERQLLQTDLDSADASALAGIADGCVHTGLFKMAADLYGRSGREAGEVASKVVTASEIMAKVGATDAQVVDRIAAAAAVVKSMSDHPLIAYDMFAMESEGILYRFMVNASIDRLIDIDSSIDAELSGKFNDPIDEWFSIGVCPYEAGSPILAMEGFYVSV
jgi:hypothetical protein